MNRLLLKYKINKFYTCLATEDPVYNNCKVKLADLKDGIKVSEILYDLKDNSLCYEGAYALYIRLKRYSKNQGTAMLKYALVVATILITMVALHTIVNAQAQRNEWVENRQVETIRVAPNETLWQIAEEHKPDFMDTRDYIYEIKQLNNMQSSSIYIGDELYIYTYEN